MAVWQFDRNCGLSLTNRSTSGVLADVRNRRLRCNADILQWMFLRIALGGNPPLC
jgi:hypothetical protein